MFHAKQLAAGLMFGDLRFARNIKKTPFFDLAEGGGGGSMFRAKHPGRS
ncbi:MAG: hypothetical protein MPL62_06090 [Alphaproteobacteria bacterium]|nr:hypothetical protein [Alphaproteobacteria bacterium]